MSDHNASPSSLAQSDGMDMRDYFAAKAMQAMLSSHQCHPLGMNFEEDYIARRAFRMADEMLKHRTK